ncbi:hypothetical protein HK104_004495 [Borealophlyctis nickersoniae]|nr:hypothetical protein HK104_004495 [Borealophlyctis nickersoniae]
MSAPDMSPAAIIGTNYCGILITFTVFGSCLPSFLAIRDIQLKVSIALFFSLFVLALITSCCAWNALTQANLVDFERFNIISSVTWIAAFLAQSFYSLRRTCMIYNASPRVQLWLPIFMSVCQCAIQYVNSAYWCIDMIKYYGTIESEETGHATIASIVWILVTEPIYFALLQYKIVQSATGFHRANKDRVFKTLALWVEAGMRLLLYVLTVLFAYLAVSNYLKPGQLAHWSFIVVFPAGVGLIFLTDVARFQKALGKTNDGSSNKTNTPDIRSEIVESATKHAVTTIGRPGSLPYPKKTSVVEEAAVEV